MQIVFDIGGTKMRLGSSRDGETLEKTIVVETPTDYETGIDKFKQAVQALSNGEPIDVIAGGIAGPFSQKKSSLLTSPNLKSWIGKPFKADLETTFNAPVHVENDSAIVGLGEAVRGAGKGRQVEIRSSEQRLRVHFLFP